MKTVVASVLGAVLTALASMSWYVEVKQNKALQQEKAGWSIVLKASKCGGV